MRKITNYIKSYLQDLKTDRTTQFDTLFYGVVLLFFLVNSSYVFYPDEFVNILGGVSINEGLLPYKHYFDHHLPFAWYFSALLLKLSGQSYTHFRTLWALFQFGLLMGTALWIRKHYVSFYRYFLGFFFIYPLAAVYFWFHLYLADSLATLFFSVIFWILVVQTITGRIRFNAIIAASLLTFCLIFSSLTFLYLALILYAWQVVLIGFRPRKIGLYVLASAAPYLLYLIYLLLTGTFQDFFFANFTYNTTLYISIPNYTKGHYFNPLKFALTLIFNFWTNYLPLLSKIKYLDLYLPMGVLAGISTLSLLILMFTRNVLFAVLFFFLLSFSAPRSNIQMQSETDYQMSLFLMLGAACAFIVLYLARESRIKDVLLNDGMRIVQAIIAVLLFFTGLFLLANTYNKYFLRYTQQIPSINNIGYTSDFFDRTLNKGEYYWVGPYDPNEEFFVHTAKRAGKYPSLLPQFREDESLKQAFIKEIDTYKPKLIVYKHTASIFMTPADIFGDFFLTWMKGKYTQLSSLKQKIKQSPSSFNIDTDLYVLNEDKQELLSRLRNAGFIE